MTTHCFDSFSRFQIDRMIKDSAVKAHAPPTNLIFFLPRASIKQVTLKLTPNIEPVCISLGCFPMSFFSITEMKEEKRSMFKNIHFHQNCKRFKTYLLKRELNYDFIIPEINQNT